MEDNNLILLTLNLNIPNLWENALVQNFPEARFIVKQSQFVGEDSFGGLLKIEGENFRKINCFLKENYPFVSLEVFQEGANLFYFSSPDNILPPLLKNFKCVMVWPIEFLERGKKVKFILNESKIDPIICFLEKNNVEITKFSKIKINFGVKEFLTPKQREVLVPSLKNGYYDFPKKITLNDLSKKIGLSPSTLCVHLQKIESKILNLDYNELFFQKIV